MSNIRGLIGLPKTDGDLGVEIEVEGDNLPLMMGSPWWKVTQDGSLRGESAEYVLKHPLDLTELGTALLELKNEYKNRGSDVRESFRAGVHVHVNCQTLTTTELFNLICLYLIFEKTFIKWCGQAREGNLFCLSASDADYLLSAIREQLQLSVREGNLIYFLNLLRQGDIIRYSSMNLASLSKYGSLEFRGMRSTPKLKLIYTWAEVLLNLRVQAKRYPQPQNIMYESSAQGVESFIDDVLGPEHSKMFKENDPDYYANVLEGIRNAQEIAFSVDWNSVEKLADKKVGDPVKVKMPRALVGEMNPDLVGAVEERAFIRPRFDIDRAINDRALRAKAKKLAARFPR